MYFEITLLYGLRHPSEGFPEVYNLTSVQQQTKSDEKD